MNKCDELVKALRENAERYCRHCSEKIGEHLCGYKGDQYCSSKTLLDAADAIEELSKLADAIPHVCECCVGCELEKKNEGCDYAFVLSPKRAMQYLIKPHWIPVTERLPECEWGAEVGNIEWISCGTVFAGCFGRGGKYRDAYFRTWTDSTEGIDAKGADYWRPIQIPEAPKEEKE